ncbi:Uncharacterised protein [Mycobacteroides abscessus subsp. abscessus]|nr:Uncharacterised protein [Mycobacteroides abscessus subsp. abscessus]
MRVGQDMCRGCPGIGDVDELVALTLGDLMRVIARRPPCQAW